jgi:hypothetical protein
MPYVRRGADGRIESLHRERGVQAMEFLDERHPDVQAFLGRPVTGVSADDFSRLDAEFVRVIEDVIDTLIVKNVINITDLPAEAQAKLFARKSFRERVSKASLRLFAQPTDFGDVI